MQPITADLLHKLAMGGDVALCAALAPELEAQLAQAGIDTVLRQAHFLAQACYESGYFARLTENLNYSTSRIAEVFPRLASRSASLAHNPEALANAAYASRFGNGDEASRDGFRFRGRGLFQLTFRDNYAAQGLADDPDIVATPAGAVSSAIAYWNSRKCNEAADSDNCPRVTLLINGGSNGLSDRSVLKHRAGGLLT